MLTIHHLSQIAIEGLDAESFLQSQLTCDVTKIAASQAQLTAYCNRQGYIEALFHLSRTNAGFLAVVPTGLSEHILSLFKKYGAFSKIQLRLEHPPLPLVVQPQEPPLLIHDHQLSLAAPTPDFCQGLTDGDAFWRAYWLSHGIATLDQSTSGVFRPHDLNLIEQGAVCMTKGCYPGQEIVARMHYLGKIKQRLQRLVVMTEQTLSPGQVLGPLTVIDALMIEPQQWLITALIRDEIYQSLPHTYDFGVLQPWLY